MQQSYCFVTQYKLCILSQYYILAILVWTKVHDNEQKQRGVMWLANPIKHKHQDTESKLGLRK